MSFESDRKLDILGAVLAAIIVLSIALLVFGALQGPSASDEPPAANWTVERINDSHVVLALDGGPPIRSENVAVTVNGRNRPTPFQGVIREGDEAAMPVTSGRTVRIYWIGGDGTRELMHEATP